MCSVLASHRPTCIKEEWYALGFTISDWATLVPICVQLKSAAWEAKFRIPGVQATPWELLPSDDRK